MSWVALPLQGSHLGIIGAVVQPAQTRVRESQVQPCGDDSCLSPGSYLDAHLPADVSSPLLPCLLWFGQPSPTASPFCSLPPAGMCSPPLVKRQPDCGLLHDPSLFPRAPATFPRHLVYVAFNICCLLLLLFLELYRFLGWCHPMGLSMVMNAVQCGDHWPHVAVDSWKCGSGNRATGFLVFSSLMNVKSSSHRWRGLPCWTVQAQKKLCFWRVGGETGSHPPCKEEPLRVLCRERERGKGQKSEQVSPPPTPGRVS